MEAQTVITVEMSDYSFIILTDSISNYRIEFDRPKRLRPDEELKQVRIIGKTINPIRKKVSQEFVEPRVYHIDTVNTYCSETFTKSLK